MAVLWDQVPGYLTESLTYTAYYLQPMCIQYWRVLAHGTFLQIFPTARAQSYKTKAIINLPNSYQEQPSNRNSEGNLNKSEKSPHCEEDCGKEQLVLFLKGKYPLTVRNSL